MLILYHIINKQQNIAVLEEILELQICIGQKIQKLYSKLSVISYSNTFLMLPVINDNESIEIKMKVM